MTVDIDPDAVLWSAGPAERDGRPLLVVMHGRGSNEEDLFGLAPELPDTFVIASLRAPIAEGGGWSWWEPGDDNQPGDPFAENVDVAVAAVCAWLDALPFTPSQVGALGFSQGGVMALHLLRRDLDRIAFAVNLAGFSVSGGQESDAALEISQPPVFWGRGADDVVISSAAIARTDEWLPKYTTLEAHIYPDLGHSLSRDELADVVAFLRAQAPSA
ncbi:dienelactone hydrolase family protein [soil metagenome]